MVETKSLKVMCNGEEKNTDQDCLSTNSFVSQLIVGCRVQDRKNADRGIVKYVGVILNSEGIWVGVDWDDEARGKHDGCHNGVSYFTTWSPTSGSFVRQGKLVTGVSIEEAVRDKYQAAPPDSTPVEQMLQHAINARFVQFVGMEMISKKQSALHTLRLVELKDCLVSHVACAASLSLLLPRLTHLSLRGSLLTQWSTVAHIVGHLPKLQLLDVSENRLSLPSDPSSLTPSLCHVTHLVMNCMLPSSTCTWKQLLTCTDMFPHLHTLQVAYNQLLCLGSVPAGSLTSLEVLDVGANPLDDWAHMLCLGHLPRLVELNVNNCKFPCVEFPTPHTTDLFPHLQSLYIANNPLDNWRSVCQLSKLTSLENLAFSFKVTANDYFPEFTYAIIRSLKILNRTRVTPKEKRDYELFYLKSFSGEYYAAGGCDADDGSGNVEPTNLAPAFKEKHPTYLQLVKEIGAPIDERESEECQVRRSRLRDQKICVTVQAQDGRTEQQSLLPSVKVSRLKMTLKKTFKLPMSTKLNLTHRNNDKSGDSRKFSVPLDCDHRTLSYYSVSDGDLLVATW